MAEPRRPIRSPRSSSRTPCSCSRPARRSTCSETRHRVSGAHCRLRRLRNRAARLAARSKAVGLRRRSRRVGLPRRDAARCGLACSLRCARQGPPYAGCAGRGGPTWRCRTFHIEAAAARNVLHDRRHRNLPAQYALISFIHIEADAGRQDCLRGVVLSSEFEPLRNQSSGST